MATKGKKSTVQRIMDTVRSLVRQPMSDESYEVPTPAEVRRSKAVAAGPRKRKATKAKARARTGAKAKKRTAKKR